VVAFEERKQNNEILLLEKQNRRNYITKIIIKIIIGLKSQDF
jgi:hypothetical protein